MDASFEVSAARASTTRLRAYPSRSTTPTSRSAARTTRRSRIEMRPSGRMRLEAGDNYDALAADAEGLGNNVTARLDSLSDDVTGTPEEQLQDALGPEDTGSDLYACSTGGVSCEVASLEQKLENDQEDIYGESGTSASPCDIVDFPTTRTTRALIARAGPSTSRPGITSPGRYRDWAIRRVRRGRPPEKAADARDDAEAAGDTPSELEYSVADTDQMVADADAAEKEVGQAIETADIRYASYEGRASEIIDTGPYAAGRGGMLERSDVREPSRERPSGFLHYPGSSGPGTWLVYSSTRSCAVTSRPGSASPTLRTNSGRCPEHLGQPGRPGGSPLSRSTTHTMPSETSSRSLPGAVPPGLRRGWTRKQQVVRKVPGELAMAGMPLEVWIPHADRAMLLLKDERARPWFRRVSVSSTGHTSGGTGACASSRILRGDDLIWRQTR